MSKPTQLINNGPLSTWWEGHEAPSYPAWDIKTAISYPGILSINPLFTDLSPLSASIPPNVRVQSRPHPFPTRPAVPCLLPRQLMASLFTGGLIQEPENVQLCSLPSPTSNLPILSSEEFSHPSSPLSSPVYTLDTLQPSWILS